MPPLSDRPALRHLRVAVLLLGVVLLGGSLGYWALGAGPLDAVYRAVTVVTTVGFQQPPADHLRGVFTIALVLLGVGTALYAFGALVELLIEGQLAATVGRRRMERRIAAMSGHVVICGWVASAVWSLTSWPAEAGLRRCRYRRDRLAGLDYPSVVGDATDDNVLRAAGRGAKALVTVMSNDAADLYVTLSGRSLNPGLFIIGRARSPIRRRRCSTPEPTGSSIPSRSAVSMAALLLQPHVAEFVDVVTREAGMEFRLEEFQLAAGSPLCGMRLKESHIRRRTGALVLALRQPDGTFLTNPTPDTTLTATQVMIASDTRPARALADMATASTRQPPRDPRHSNRAADAHHHLPHQPMGTAPWKIGPNPARTHAHAGSHWPVDTDRTRAASYGELTEPIGTSGMALTSARTAGVGASGPEAVFLSSLPAMYGLLSAPGGPQTDR